MRHRTALGSLVPLVVVLTLTLGACADPAPAGADVGAPVTVASPIIPAGQSGPGTSAPGTSAPGTAAPGSSAAAQSVIPSAPGTAGTGALPPVDTVPAVTSGAGVVATPLPSCKSSTLKTVLAGKLTIAASATGTAPWFVGTDAASGRGLEPAVAMAVAGELGYRTADVVWTKADAAAVAAGRTSGFDLAVGEFAAPDQRSTAVDYSTGYFSISQSVVARSGTPTAAAKSLAQLRSARLAAVSGTTGRTMASAQIAGAKAPARYPTTAAGLAALRAGTVDAVVLPTPTAITAVEGSPGLTVVGQLVDPGEQPQQFGMILPKKSPLTSCVSAAIDQLRVTGVLQGLVQKWVPAAAKPLR